MAELGPVVEVGGAAEQLIATVWTAVTRPQGRRVHISRTEVVERFRVPAVTSDKRRLAGWAPTAFRGDYRELVNVEACFAVGLDLDEPGTDLDIAVRALAPFAGFVYSSYRHTPDRHRGRAIVWTSRPISADEYGACWRCIAARTPGVAQEAKDASRLWYVPGIPPGGAYRLVELHGQPLDVEEALAESKVRSAEVPHVAPLPTVGDELESVVMRARAWLAHADPAIEGQNGSGTAFRVVERVVRGFGLDDAAALDALAEWNLRCVPPWDTSARARPEDSLVRLIHRARQRGDTPIGGLLPWLASSQGPGRGLARGGGDVDRATVQRAKVRRRQDDPSRPPIWRVTFDLVSDHGELFSYRFVVPSDGYDSEAIRTRYRAALPDVDCSKLRTECDCDLTSRFARRVYETERRGGEVRRVELVATGRVAP